MKLTVKSFKVMSACVLMMGVAGNIVSTPVFAQESPVITLDDPNHVEGEKFRVVSVKVQYEDGSAATGVIVSIFGFIDNLLGEAKTDNQGILRFNGRETDPYVIRVMQEGEKVEIQYEVPRGDDKVREVVLKLKNKPVEKSSETSSTSEESKETSETSSAPEENKETSETSSALEESKETSETSSALEESKETSETSSASEESKETSETSSALEENKETSETSSAPEENKETSETSSASEESKETSETSSAPEESKETNETSSAPEESKETKEGSDTNKKPEVNKAEFHVVVYEEGTTKGLESLEVQVENEEGKVLAKGKTNQSGLLRVTAPAGKTYVIRVVSANTVKSEEKITVPEVFDKDKSTVAFYVRKSDSSSDKEVSTSESSAPKLDESKNSTAETLTSQPGGSQVSGISSVKVTPKDNDETKTTPKSSETQKEAKQEIKTASKGTETKKEEKTLPKTGESTGVIALVAGVVTAILGGGLLLVGKKSKKKE